MRNYIVVKNIFLNNCFKNNICLKISIGSLANCSVNNGKMFPVWKQMCCHYRFSFSPFSSPSVVSNFVLISLPFTFSIIRNGGLSLVNRLFISFFLIFYYLQLFENSQVPAAFPRIHFLYSQTFNLGRSLNSSKNET